MQEIMNENVEQQKVSFMNEKKELVERMEQLSLKIAEKERELSYLQHNQEQVS